MAIRFRYIATRLLVRLAMKICPETDWVFERLYWLNNSLEMRLGRVKVPGKVK